MESALAMLREFLESPPPKPDELERLVRQLRGKDPEPYLMKSLRPIIERGGAPARSLMEHLGRFRTQDRVLTEDEILYHATRT